MNTRTFAVFALAAAVGAFAFAPAHAQDSMAASSSTAMAHEAMPAKDGMMMKKDAMKHDAMKHKAMKKDGMMKKHDAMKMKKDAGDAMSGGN